MAKVDDTENIRIRLGPDLREKWKAVLEDRRISQQRAVVELFDWLCRQDPLTQAMIFGQVPRTDQAELSRIVLQRLAGKRK